MSLKIISFCNYPYREIALNWVKHLEELSIDNYEVLCLDAESYGYLKAHDCHSRMLDEFDDDWISGCKHTMRRTLIFKKLLEEGFDIIHSDTDALWLKNPIPDLIEANYQDIIVSTVRHGYAFPPEVREALGFTCCMGWIFFRSNQNTINYLDRFLSTREIKGSDQKNFNQFLLHNNPNVKSHNLGDDLSIYNTVDENYNYKELSLLALSKPLVKRGPIEASTYVWHPNTKKEAEHKRESFVNAGKWRI
jgi:hypothetical protein